MIVPLQRLAPPVPERFGFLTAAGESLYYVLHPSVGPARARVVLAGPLGLERQTSYVTWVRWARFLAARGYESLHFDYRGSGESTGEFQGATLGDWLADLAAAVAMMKEGFDRPVFVCGLRLGALLASHLFARGHSDGMLLWDPPASGQTMLGEVLRRKLASDLLEGTAAAQKSREAYVSELLAGRVLDIEGHAWTARLWTDAASWPLRIPDASETRPWLVTVLDRRPCPPGVPPAHQATVPVPKPSFWSHDPFVIARVSELFDHGAGFFDTSLKQPGTTP